MSLFQKIALALVIVGAVNWGLIGFFEYDLVAAIFGGASTAIARTVYALVGISGLYAITLLFKPSEEYETRRMQPTS
ncbi:MAG: DUF378 domain-containing protein [Eubacteriales bacterium]